MKLSEMETTINFYADEKRARIYTCDPAWIGKLNKLCALAPDECKLERSDGVGYWFTLPRVFIKLRPKRTLSEKQREVLERMSAQKKCAQDEI